MIVWINGSFASGKTTIAEKLKDIITNSIIYDPEEVGEFLLKIMPTKLSDFQDYDLWRTLNFEILKDLSKSKNVVIVPMTITNKIYYDEIVGRLRNEDVIVKDFILIAKREVIVERLGRRGNSTEWAYEQVDRCVKAFEGDFGSVKIDTNDKDVLEVLSEILKFINN